MERDALHGRLRAHGMKRKTIVGVTDHARVQLDDGALLQWGTRTRCRDGVSGFAAWLAVRREQVPASFGKMALQDAHPAIGLGVVVDTTSLGCVPTKDLTEN